MKAFNWVHLTDLHYGLTGQAPLWPNVRQVFYDDLAKLHDRSGPWHAVLFTGDLTQTGNDDEFAQLEEKVLGPLWEHFKRLGSQNVFLIPVPGNHDLVRPDTKKPGAALRHLLRPDSFQEIEEEFWDDPKCEYRAVIDKAFENYLKWCKTSKYCFGQAVQRGILPGDLAATYDIRSSSDGRVARIGIAGLNTTFLQLAAGDYTGRLACDVRQIHSACGNDIPSWIQQHDACLLLSHQGPEWLDTHSRDDIYPEINPAGRFAVHLFGHMHKTVQRSTSMGGGPALRLWQGSSLFGLEKFGEPPTLDRRHGYSIGRIEFSEGAPTIRHWPRRAIKDTNGWRFEPDTENCVLDEKDGGTRQEQLFAPPRVTAATGRISRRPSECLPSAKNELRYCPASDPSFRDYCEAVCKAHSHIRFAEIPYLKDVSDVELDNLYVEPRFSSHEIHPDTHPSRWPECLYPVDVLRQHSRIVLLGDPGSGKSTLVSCISWHLCRSHPNPDNPWTRQFDGFIPLPMILRELRLKADLTWEGLLEAFLEHRIGCLLRGRKNIEELLRQGRAVVLLDGLDEIGNLSVRRKLRDAIHIGMAAYPLSTWLLTSRMVGYEQVPFHTKIESISAKTETTAEVLGQTKRTKRVRTAMADVFFLAPFNDQQIEAFGVNWYTQHEKDKDVVKVSAQGFVSAIRENEGTQRLGRIPYLLTLMALIHHKNARLPHGRTELYERIATAYLESIDLRRQLDQLPYSLTQKKRWLASVAYQMQLRRSQKGGRSRRGDILVGEREVQLWLRKAMVESGTNESKRESEALLTYFAERSGLLLPRGEGRFAFMHLSLQEYFAACCLLPRLTASRFSTAKRRFEPSNEQLRAWANSEIWTETFILLFELLSEKSVDETEGLLGHLFDGQLESDREGTKASMAVLLAELATDPFVLLTAETRRQMRQRCWRWCFGLRRREPWAILPRSSGNKVIRTLMRENDGDLRKSWLASSIGQAELKKVTALNLSGAPLADLSPLIVLRGLTALNLGGCTAVSDLGPLAKLPDLAQLAIEGCPNITSLEPLRGAKKLRLLVLGAPCDLSPLAGLESLRDLHIHYETEDLDLSPIAHLPKVMNICYMRDPLRAAALLAKHSDKIVSPALRRLVRHYQDLQRNTRRRKRPAVGAVPSPMGPA